MRLPGLQGQEGSRRGVPIGPKYGAQTDKNGNAGY